MDFSLASFFSMYHTALSSCLFHPSRFHIYFSLACGLFISGVSFLLIFSSLLHVVGFWFALCLLHKKKGKLVMGAAAVCEGLTIVMSFISQELCLRSIFFCLRLVGWAKRDTKRENSQFHRKISPKSFKLKMICVWWFSCICLAGLRCETSGSCTVSTTSVFPSCVGAQLSLASGSRAKLMLKMELGFPAPCDGVQA